MPSVLSEPTSSNLTAFLDRLATRLERRARWYAWTVAAAFVLIALWLATRKIIWFDEVITLEIARQPSLGEIWRALLAGADQMTLFFHLITHASLQLVHALALPYPDRLGLRLPSILAVLVFLLALRRFVSVRLGPLYGLLAMLAPINSIVFTYSLEARAYALMLAFTGLAAVCWQAATHESSARRPLWLAALALSLTAAFASHYYAVFFSIPLGAAELVRYLQRRIADRPMYLSLLLPLATLLLEWPQLQANLQFPATFWTHPSLNSYASFLLFYFAPGATGVALVLLLLLLFSRSTHLTSHSSSVPQHEVVFALAALLIPAAEILAAALGLVPAYMDRYALSAAFGLSLLLPFGLRFLRPSRPLLAVCLLVLPLTALPSMLRVPYLDLQPALPLTQSLEAIHADPDSPVLMLVGMNMAEVYASAPPQLARRLFYVYDLDLSRSTRAGLVDMNFALARPWLAEKVVPFAEFSQRREPILAWDIPGERWLSRELLKRGWRIELVHENNGRLYRITPPLPH